MDLKKEVQILDKKTATKLGERVLENTFKVITNLPDNEKMVLGTEVLTKPEIIQRFKEDEQFAVFITEHLVTATEEFMIRKKYGKKRGKKK